MWRDTKEKKKRARRGISGSARILSLLLAMLLMLSVLTPAYALPVYADETTEVVEEVIEEVPETEETQDIEIEIPEGEPEEEAAAPEEESVDEAEAAQEETASEEATEEELEEEEPEEELEEEEVLSLFALSGDESRYETLDGRTVYNFTDDIHKVVVKINGEEIELGENTAYDELIGEDVSFEVILYYNLAGYTLGEDQNGQTVRTIIYSVPEALSLDQDESGYVYNPSNPNEAVGTYQLSTNGLVVITFYDSYVNNNANGNPITNGYVRWSATVERDSTSTTDTRTVSFTGKHQITFQFYQMEKSGKLSDDGNYAEWTVRLNENNAQLQGYELNDQLFYSYANDSSGKAYEVELEDYLDGEVTLKNVRTGESATIDLVEGYTFGSTTDAYEMTYRTRIDSYMGLSLIRNEVYLSKDGQEFEADASVTPLEPATLKKTNSAITYSKDGNTAYVEWTITLTTGGAGIPKNGIPMNDVLGYNLRYTKAQLQEAYDAITAALEEVGLDPNFDFYTTVNNSNLTLDQLDDSALYTNFHFVFQEDLPANKTITIRFTSQQDISTTAASSLYGTNTISLGDDEGQTIGVNIPNNKGSYSLQKIDQIYGKNQWSTTHDYYDDNLEARTDEAGGLIEAGTRRLVWTIRAQLPNSYQNTEKDLTLDETLPSGISYENIVIGIRHKYGDDYHYTTITSDSTLVDLGTDGTLELDEATRTVAVKGSNTTNRTFTITIPKELASAGYGEEGEGQLFELIVYVPISAPSKEVDGTIQKDTYLNQVWLNLVVYDTLYATQQTNVTNKNPHQKDPIQKEVYEQGDGSNSLLYSVIVNPDQLDLAEGSDKITVEDVLTYTREDGELFELGLTEIREGVSVYILRTIGDETVTLSEDDYSVTYHTREEDGIYYRTLSFTLDDHARYQILYVYHGTGVTGASSDVVNTVKLIGATTEEYQATVETKLVLQESRAGASTDLNKIQLRKTDYDLQYQGISNVSFALHKLGSDTALKTVTTDSSGYAELLQTDENGFAFNTIYYLQETSVPSGYQSDDTKYYFYIQGTGTAPDLSEAGLTESQVKVIIPGDTIQITNKKYVDLTIHKVDADDTSVSTEALQGAQFTLYELGETTSETDDTQVGTQQTTDENAEAVFRNLSRDVIYKLVEDVAPDGYTKQEEPYYFYIASGDTNVVIDDSAVPDTYKDSVHVVDTLDHSLKFANTKYAKIELVKVNAKSGAKLEGAKFALWKVDASGTSTIPNTSEKGIKITEDVTAADGTLSFDTVGDGVYYLVETSAPEGYVQLTEAIKVNVENGTASLANETNTTYTLAKGVSGATSSEGTTTASWTFCINPTSKRPNNTENYTLLENVDFRQVVSHIDGKDLKQDDGEFTADEYRKIQRLLYWYLTEKDAYVVAAKERTGLTESAIESNVYENVQRMIWEILRNGAYKNNVTSANDTTGLWNYLYGNGSTTGLINGTQYDASIENHAIFDIFVRPDSGVQNMITIRTKYVSASQEETVIQIGNTPNPGNPTTTSFAVSLTKVWENVDESKLPDEITLTLEQVVNNEIVGTSEITVTKKEEWKYTSTSFAATDNSGNTITYRVKEAGENDGKVILGNNLYQVTYVSEAASDGVDITVTNKLIQNISQPETGANTRWFSLIGGTSLLLMAVMYFFMRRRSLQ